MAPPVNAALDDSVPPMWIDSMSCRLAKLLRSRERPPQEGNRHSTSPAFLRTRDTPSGPRLLALITLLGLSVASCDSDGPTGVSAFNGTYVIDMVEDEPLPHVYLLAPLTGDTLMLLGGELQVLSRGRVRMLRSWQWRPRTAPPGVVTIDTLVRAYREVGDLVLIDHLASPTSDAFTDTVQFLQRLLLVRTLIIVPINVAQYDPLRRELFYARP
jgi:hypothetical protein